MSRKFLVPIDLTKQELQNAAIQNLAAPPANPVAGQVYFNTVDSTLYFYDGRSPYAEAGWIAAKTNPYSYADTGETTDVSITATESEGISLNLARADHQHAGPGFGNVTSQTSYGASSSNGSASTVARSDHSHGTPALSNATPEPLVIGDSGSAGTATTPARADHTHAGPGFGSPYAIDAFGLTATSGVSDMVARADHSHGSPVHDGEAHNAIKLSDLAAPSADLSIGTHKLTNVVDPTNDQDAATKNYVDDKPLNSFTATGDVSLNSHKITNLADPVNPSDAANKAYVDGAISGLDWKNSVNLLSTTNVPLTGSTGLVIDGHAALDSTDNGYRILLTGQTTAADNGIYTFSDDGTNYTLTRSEDANQYQELINASVFVSEGTIYGKTSWVQASHYLTSFAGQDWVQFSGQGTYVAGNGLELTGNSFAFKPTSTGGLQVDGTGASIKLKTDANGSGLEVKSTGLAVVTGTGLTINTNLVSIDTNVVARKYSETLTGALSSNVYVTHNLGTKDVTVQVYTVADGSQVEVDITRATNDSVILGFAVAPTSGVYRAVVIG